MISSLRETASNSIMYICNTLTIHESVLEHQGVFHILVILLSAASK